MLTEQQLVFLRSEPGSNRVAKAMALAGVTQVTVAKALRLAADGETLRAPSRGLARGPAVVY